MKVQKRKGKKDRQGLQKAALEKGAPAAQDASGAFLLSYPPPANGKDKISGSLPAEFELCYPQLVGTIQLSGGRRHVNPFFVFGKGALHRFPLAFLLGFAGIGKLLSHRFIVGQGSGGALPVFSPFGADAPVSPLPVPPCGAGAPSSSLRGCSGGRFRPVHTRKSAGQKQDFFVGDFGFVGIIFLLLAIFREQPLAALAGGGFLVF